MNKSLIETYDKQNYLTVLLSFHEQLLSAENNISNHYSQLTGLKTSAADVRNIVICGMGGSAIAGDFVKQIFSDHLSIPINVNRDYTLPPYVNEKTLVILSSYSGNTEETVSAFNDAVRHNARIITISTGGAIKELSNNNSIPHIAIPGGFQPRQAIGYSLVTLFRMMEHLFMESHDANLISGNIAWINEKQKLWSSPSGNELWNWAEHLSVQPVIIYSSEKMFPAALRFKGQICENAKLLAFANTLPEMNHNEIVGWDGVQSSAPFSVMLIRDAGDHPQIQKRFDILKKILSKKTALYEMYSEGPDSFSKFMSLIYRGDWLSYFMAIVRKTDPTPVDIITQFKNELSK
ncbi:bifunctional phosphoglucose/phosphomannose isomerase [bacterium]|nr:bifunctional phosphoglucose/phosphomannose isomerase [bacterium]